MNTRRFRSVGLKLLVAGLFLGAGAGCGPFGTTSSSSSGGTAGTGGTGGTGGEGVCAPRPVAEEAKESDTFEDGEGHWIVLQDGLGGCASINGMGGKWTGSRLFNGSVNGVPLGGLMARYCDYFWEESVMMAPPDMTALAGLPKARNRRAITPQTTAQSWAHDTFLLGMALPSQPAPPADNPHVRVIVADTVGVIPGSTGNQHGRLMADLVLAMARCPASGDCSVKVETQLALPRIRNVATNKEEVVTTGGDFGRIADLIGAVGRAISHYEEEMDSGDTFPEILALNLSIGFEPQPKLADESFAADEAVKDTLRAFACHGGVTFAAAGNHSGAKSTGLLAPAAFQDELEPLDLDPNDIEIDCEDLLGIDFFKELKGRYQAAKGSSLHRIKSRKPFIQAVGGFDQGGVPIKKTREPSPESLAMDPPKPDACPRYGAPGLGWGEDAVSELLLTGTSVPTAVVSGFYATAMAQTSFTISQGLSITTPYLKSRPHEVLDQLSSMSATREFGSLGPCGDQWTCGEIPWFGGQGPSAQNIVSNFPLPPAVGSASQGDAQDNGCKRPTLCEGQALSAVSVIFPQPNDIPCVGGCSVQRGSPAYFYINPSMDLKDAKLTIEDSSGASTILDITASLSAVAQGTQDMLMKSTQYKIELRGVTVPADARLSFSAFDGSGNRTVNEQVLLVQ